MPERKLESMFSRPRALRHEGERRWRRPVRWLLDRQLITSLREILLYSVFGTWADPRTWMVGCEADFTSDPQGGELWFDYLSDSGDGMRATYSIAYLAYSELFAPATLAPGDPVAFEASGAAPRSLPRGAFLFVGGDTAYHVADYETLAERFQLPFQWAFDDLAALGKVDTERRRPIFGIPGNHDYYDLLDGFNRQFRQPFGAEHGFDPSLPGDQPQLVLKGFERGQWASYVSLALPFGWRMWGMDAQGGAMDRRQKHFFRSLTEGPGRPTRLIVATPEPITAFGKRRRPDSDIVDTLRSLGLECPFLDPPEPQPAGGCRLDLSGDVHHYARYWGAAPGAAQPASYASVVSGLGGAFLHPSCTDVGEVPAKVRYPEPRRALAEVVRPLLRSWSIVAGGRIWLFGSLVAGLIFLAATTSASLQSILEPLLERAHVDPPTLAEGHAVGAGLVVKALSALQTALDVKRTVVGDPDVLILQAEGSEHWANRELIYLPVLLVLAGYGTWRNSRLGKKAKRGSVFSSLDHRWPIWLLAMASALSASWIYRLWPFGNGKSQYGQLAPLASNFVLLAVLALSYLGLLWCRQYDDAMNRLARTKWRLTWVDQAHGYVLWAFTLLTGLFGFTRYGIDPVAVVSIDVAFLVAVLGILVGLPVFAWKVGGELHGKPGKIGFAVLGLGHALLQLAIPLLLVLTLPWRLALGAGAAALLFGWGVSLLALRWLGRPDASDRRRLGFVLLLLWLAWTAGLVALAFAWQSPRPISADGASFLTDLALGSIFSCTLFGWYLAISICFDGHNNEAGGGARIERFKQFIRFRLTAQGLTGFVIAIDEPQEDGSRLMPRLIDVFEVRPS